MNKMGNVAGQFSRTLILLFAGILIALALTACNSGSRAPSTARANAPQSMPVTVAPVLKQDFPVYLSGLGSIQAFYTVSVKSRVDGQLLEVKFREGEHVNKGDLLAVIDPRPYQVQLDQAQATLFKDQASLRDAQLNYQRYKDLLQNSGAISQQQVDTQKATVDQLEGTVRNDQALVDNAKLNLSYSHITAPQSGRIGLRLVDPGNMVHASDANPMLVITQLQPITAIFTLPEDQLPTVAKQLRRGSLEVDAYSRDDSTKIATGKLLTIDNQIDQTTGTGRLKAVFSNEDSVLWPNQFVNIHLLLETRKNATVVPSAAIQQGPEGTYVYVVRPDKTVEARNVEVATTEGTLAQIASGVSPSETVVTDGQDKLQNNSRVEPHTIPATPRGG
ncbi:MAG TPA: efflux RND transporter periplasmic adaptor subunit, partial [Terriglobales bacterium]|nr:efflux RND transporter periplasmic adaptor subunit [Terriglobales bacterium]